MATVFQLKEGATTTDLNDASNTFLSKYTPATKNVGVETVTETAVIVIANANAATLDSVREGIIQRLYNAHARQSNHARDRTYIHFQPDGAAAENRSEILEGRITNERNAHGEAWGSNPVEFSIIWTRRNYWEGAEAQVPLTNTNGTDNTAGLNIYNCNDGAGASPNDQVNYCDLKAADIDGELPGATRIEMVNPFATGDLGYVWIGHNFTDPADFVWSYEAEDATSTGSTEADATASDGDYEEIDVVDSTWVSMLKWSLTAGSIDAAKGGMVKGIVRFFEGINSASIPRIWFRIMLDIGAFPLFYTARVKPDANFALVIRDLFTFNLPPWLRGITDQSAINLTLQAYQITGITQTLDIDTLFLFPADGWRYIQVNHLVDQGERLVDDGINDIVYVDDAAGDDKHSIAVGYGSPILLEPGKLQRLYFATHSTAANTSPIDRYLVVKVFYRPRRYTI
jgi:hypothetical protein